MVSIPVPRPLATEVALRVQEYLAGLNPALAGIAARLPSPDQGDGGHTVRILTGNADWVLDFYEVTDSLVRDQVRFAWALLTMHTILQDERIDDDLDRSIRSRSDLLSNLLLADSLALLDEVAGHATDFHGALHNAFVDLATAYTAEPELDVHLATDRDQYIKLVTDRVATVKVSASAVGCRAGHTERLPILLDVLRRLLFAQQIRDDLSDWRDDHARGRKTYVLLELARLSGQPLDQCGPDVLADELYLGGGLEELVGQMHETLRSCAARASGYPHDSLAAYIQYLIDESQALMDNVATRKSAAIVTR